MLVTVIFKHFGFNPVRALILNMFMTYMITEIAHLYCRISLYFRTVNELQNYETVKKPFNVLLKLSTSFTFYYMHFLVFAVCCVELQRTEIRSLATV